MSVTVITTATANLQKIEKHIARYNKRAMKKGWQPLVYRIKDGSQKDTKQKITIRSDIRVSDYSYTKKITIVDIEIENVEMGCHADYTLVGVAKNTDGIETVNSFVEGLSLEKYRGTQKCGHCGHNRKRSVVYLFQHTDGSIIEVGSTCIGDFFNKDSANFLSFFEFIDDITKMAQQSPIDGDGNHYSHKLFNTMEVLHTACLHSIKFGYVSVAKASKDWDLVPTKTLVADIMNKGWDRNEIHKKEHLEQAEKDVEAMLEWLAEQDDQDNDFLLNVKEVFKSEVVPERMFGYICGLIGFYRNAKAKKAKREMDMQGRLNEWLGEVGERYELEVEIKNITNFEGRYGTSYITIGRDNEGREIKYWNCYNIRNSNKQPQVGDKVKFMARIKSHDTFNDIKQTTITRPTKIQFA